MPKLFSVDQSDGLNQDSQVMVGGSTSRSVADPNSHSISPVWALTVSPCPLFFDRHTENFCYWLTTRFIDDCIYVAAPGTF
jgi:hypothetical protein